jgi:hypothetical protein
MYNIEHVVRVLPVRGVVLFADDLNESHRFTKLSILVPLQHQPSWIILRTLECALRCAASRTPSSHAVVARILRYKWEAISPSPSEILTHFGTWSDTELCDVDMAADIPLQQPYKFRCRNRIQIPCRHIMHLKTIETLCLEPPATQDNHSSRDVQTD